MTAEALLNLMYEGRGAIEPNLWRQCAIEEKIRERGPLNPECSNLLYRSKLIQVMFLDFIFDFKSYYYYL